MIYWLSSGRSENDGVRGGAMSDFILFIWAIAPNFLAFMAGAILTRLLFNYLWPIKKSLLNSPARKEQ